MKLFAILSVLLLAGCTDCHNMGIAKAEYACRHKGGMHHMQFTTGEAVCRNGEYVVLRSIILPEDYWIKEGSK